MQLLIAASALVGLASALPASKVRNAAPSGTVERRDPSATANSPAAVYSINNNDGIGAGSGAYRNYGGSGTTGAGWPAKSQWVSFEQMFNNNKNNFFHACEAYGVPNDSGEEVGDLYNAIQAIAQASHVDHRFILAIILNESTGCVRVPTTVSPGSNPKIYNPGLMQDFDGYYTCNHSQNDEYNTGGGVTTPCPQDTITNMVREGTQGTNNGDGLASLMNRAQGQGSSDAQTFYVAAHWYNQGEYSVNVGGNLGTYASNVANRLTGWTG